MSKSDRSRQIQCYQDWNNLQKQELTQLIQALNQNPKPPNSELTHLINSIIANFESYNNERSRLAEADSTPYFAPPWCTSLENSALWIGGCRPSSYIRLIYALVGLEIESQLADFLQGAGMRELRELTANQLTKINDLQMRIVRDEDRLSARLASLQEDLADEPMVVAAQKQSDGCVSSGDFDEAIEKNKKAMAGLLREADGLRLSSVKEVATSILKPVQAIRFLATSKKLRFCIHEMGEKKDAEHSRDEDGDVD